MTKFSLILFQMLKAYETYEAKVDTAILHPTRLHDPMAHCVDMVDVSKDNFPLKQTRTVGQITNETTVQQKELSPL